MELDTLKDDEAKTYKFSPLSLSFFSNAEVKSIQSELKYLWPWIKPYSKRIWVGMALFVMTSFCALSVPRMVADIVDTSLLKSEQSFSHLLVVLIGIVVFKIIADVCFKFLMTYVGQAITRDIRQDMFIKLTELPMKFYDQNSSGRIISRSVNDISNLSAFFTANFFSLFSDVVLMVGSLIMIFTLFPLSGLIILVVISTMIVYMFNVVLAQMGWSRQLRSIMSRLSGHSSDTINNLALLHSQPYSSFWFNRHAKLQKIFSLIVTRAILIWGTFSSLHVVALGITTSLSVLVSFIAIENHQLSFGSFIAICSYIVMIFNPFLDVSEKLNTLLTALSSVRRLKDLLPGPQKNHRVHPEPEISHPLPSGDIIFDNIIFRYNEGKLFDQFSLTIEENKITALVGRTGSGKSTLSHLVLQLYPLLAGKILWGNRALDEFSPKERARHIGHVGQDLFIFNDTLRENLRLFDSDITDEAILERLTLLGLKEKVDGLPQKLDTIMQIETIPFSQGERQLLVMCRLLLKNPRLLIFDEATAFLDQASENLLLKAMDKLFQNRTTLFIAHRLSSLTLAHRVVVLTHGKVYKIIEKNPGEEVSEESLL